MKFREKRFGLLDMTFQHGEARVSEIQRLPDHQSDKRRNLGAHEPRAREQVIHILRFELAAEANEIVSEADERERVYLARRAAQP